MSSSARSMVHRLTRDAGDSDPYPFCHFVTFPPDRGNRPLREKLTGE